MLAGYVTRSTSVCDGAGFVRMRSRALCTAPRSRPAAGARINNFRPVSAACIRFRTPLTWPRKSVFTHRLPRPAQMRATLHPYRFYCGRQLAPARCHEPLRKRWSRHRRGREDISAPGIVCYRAISVVRLTVGTMTTGRNGFRSTRKIAAAAGWGSKYRFVNGDGIITACALRRAQRTFRLLR